ncbi:hypothetical protein BTO06_11470 [Tenacibaculum sp. SZ-18]|uniref:hypothetical protein n=1 Tax=Tenacibaculum sp. SZ-18 TaxID=754423 RepID=UPI000C2CF019|nr:hypothetical protein [Tenacibaculum sp. SZ-18]AUC15730.1 hypothetical protein BTO06_11470 [Tenacibaculum sp. SZ-18]
MKNIKLLLLAVFSIVLFNSCTDEVEPQNTNYVTFGAESYDFGVDAGSTGTTFNIPVYTANTTGSDRTFNVTIDMDNSDAGDGSYTVPSSVTIPANSNEGSLDIILSDTNLGIGVNTLTVNFEGGVEGLSTSVPVEINYIQNCNEVTGTLDFVFDGFGSEISWQIIDSIGGVVASGSGYADGQATASEAITLCAGRTFTLVVNDSFGDGLSFPNIGSYTLTIGGTVKATGEGDFGSSQTHNFDTN